MSNISKYNSLNNSLFELVNQWHDNFWADPLMQFERNWRPTDVSETDKEYKIEVELPRFKKNEIRVEVVKGTLEIEAKNNRSHYTRTFTLSDAEMDNADVQLDSGVLTITVPKNVKSQTKVLEIKDVKQLTS